MQKVFLAFIIALAGCAGGIKYDDMTILTPTEPDLYAVATIQKTSSSSAPVHIYIEGDGRAFNNRGRATYNPTPHSYFMRDMAAADTSPNVAYVARPCQFVMDDKCSASDWTDGRFSKQMVDSMAYAIKTIAQNRPVVLIGYSGGAMISGLIIQNHHDIDVKQWITIAGVLNHADWTDFFGDAPLKRSLNLNTLPHISQIHYVAENDKIVPPQLSYKWTAGNNVITIPDAGHSSIPVIKLEFKD
ncbi:MAG: hypothetical protein J5679_00700 [Alphaproteobacteria bacterium]|nr:hypothetical protein [Alphaproteobacteria bacterium]